MWKWNIRISESRTKGRLGVPDQIHWLSKSLDPDPWKIFTDAEHDFWKVRNGTWLVPCMNELFFLSRWTYLILGNFLALNRKGNLDKISWFVLLLDSGAAHVSKCTLRYKKNTEKHVVVNYRTTTGTFPTLHPPIQYCGSESGAFWTPASGIRGLFFPWNRDPGWKKIQSQDLESGMNIPISFLG